MHKKPREGCHLYMLNNDLHIPRSFLHFQDQHYHRITLGMLHKYWNNQSSPMKQMCWILNSYITLSLVKLTSNWRYGVVFWRSNTQDTNNSPLSANVALIVFGAIILKSILDNVLLCLFLSSLIYRSLLKSSSSSYLSAQLPPI